MPARAAATTCRGAVTGCLRRAHFGIQPLPELGAGPPSPQWNGAPFTTRTEYDDQFWAKPRAPRPVEPLKYSFAPLPWLASGTSNQAFFKPPFSDPQAHTQQSSQLARGVMPPAVMPNIWETTNQAQYPAKGTLGSRGAPPPAGARRMYPPWMGAATTYADDYIPKELALVPVPLPEMPGEAVVGSGRGRARGQRIGLAHVGYNIWGWRHLATTLPLRTTLPRPGGTAIAFCTTMRGRTRFACV
jgi:hypothetical protein